MYRFKFKIGRALIAAALAAGAAGHAFAADYVMRISHQFPPTHQTAINLVQFQKDVEAATHGRVEVQLFGSAQLFKPNQNLLAVASDKVEAAAVLNFQWGGTIPEMSVSIIPYLMSSEAKQKAFIVSDAAQLLDAKMAEHGVQNIAWIVDANTGIFTSNRKPLMTPADFKGIKIRGLNKMFDAGLVAMGAHPVAMAGSEVYQALQTGVLDAGFTGVRAAYSRKYFEVQKYGVASNIILAFDNLVVNPKWWKSLPADLRGDIQQAADKAVQRSLRPDGIPADELKVLNEHGMHAVALTQAQEKVMTDAMQPAVRKEFLSEAKGDGEKLLQMIDKL
jgi:C4-dicarboxylate-binding protein DctP